MPNVQESEFLSTRNDDEWRTSLKETLHSYNGHIRFQKADGSIREMLCTLREDVLPARIWSADGPLPRKTNPSPKLITVWDLESEGFRNILYDKMISFKVVEPE